MENLRSSIEIPLSFNSYTMQWFQQLHNAMVSIVTQCNGFHNYRMQWFPQLYNAMVSIVTKCKNLGVHLTFSLTSHEIYTPLFLQYILYTMHNFKISLVIPCNGASTLSPVVSSSGKTFFAFLFFSFSLSFSFFFPFLVIIFTLKLAFDLSFLLLGRFL